MGFLQKIIDKEAPEVVKKEINARSRICIGCISSCIAGISFVVDAVERIKSLFIE